MVLQNKTRALEVPTCDDRLLWDIRMSRFYLPALTVADELGVFTLIENKPATAQEIAANLSLGARGTEALLGIVTSLGLLVQYQGKFFLTEVARNFLSPQSSFYVGDNLAATRDDVLTHAALREALVKDSLRDLTSSWQAGGLEPEQAQQFTQRMHSVAFPAAAVRARGGHFEGVKHLLDVAGGSGCYSIALALRYPETRFTVLELPSVCPITEQYIANYMAQDQIDTYAAEMFSDRWLDGYDAVFFANVFHDWDREQCLQLARRSYEALPSGGRIYVHEMLLNDTKNGPLTTCRQSMFMLWVTLGKQLTASELNEILRQSGFDEISVVPTSVYFSLVSARKP